MFLPLWHHPAIPREVSCKNYPNVELNPRLRYCMAAAIEAELCHVSLGRFMGAWFAMM
jgi:hypothetical protein